MAQQDKNTRLIKICRLSRALKRVVIWLLIVAVICGTGYVIGVNKQGGDAIIEIERMLADRSIREKIDEPADDQSNAARYWIAAGELTVDFSNETFYTIQWPGLGESYSPDVAQHLESLFEKNQLALASVELARQLKTVDFQLDSRNDFDRVMHIAMRMRRLAKALKYQAFYGISVNDDQIALQACKSLCEVVRALEDLDLLITHLLRVSVSMMAFETIEHALSHVQWTSEQLDTLRDCVKHALDIDFAKAIEAEVLYMLDCARDPQWIVSQRRLWRIEYPGMFDLPFYEKNRPWKGVPLVCFDAYEDLCVGKDQVDALEEVQGMLLAYDLLRDPNATWKMFTDIEDRMLPMILVTCRTYLENRNCYAVLLAALEFEKFRVKTGRWPMTIQEATNVVPVDRFGQSLSLSIKQDMVRIYSIGLDGIDHQGLGRMEDKSMYADHDDLAFRLLPVNQRNREPVPKPKPQIHEDGAKDLVE